MPDRSLLFCVSLVCFASVGAANLVPNPSFEGDEVVFRWGRMESPTEQVKAKDDPRYVSRPDTLHVKAGQRAWFFRCDNPDGRNTMTFAGLPVTPGKRYVFKCQYYLDDADGPTMVWGNYHEHDAAGKTSGYKNLTQFDTTPVQWNEFCCVFYASSGSATVNVALIFGGKMSVWVDEVSFAEDVEPEPVPPVGAMLPESETFSLAWLSPLTKALPTGLPIGLGAGDGSVHLDAAKNERESFQLVIGAKRDLKNVTVRMSDFTREQEPFAGGGPRIPCEAAKVREVRFVPVSGVKNLRMNRLHPDPVVPFSSGEVSAGSNMVVLVTVKTPASAASGTYKAMATVQADGIAPVTVPVRLRVRNFALPDTAFLRSYFYLSPSGFGGSYKQFDARPMDAIYDDFYALYRELRFTGNQAMARPSPKWKKENGHVVVTDWSPFDDEVERLIKNYNFSTFSVPFVGMLGDNAGWSKGDRGLKKSPNGRRTVGVAPKKTPFGGYFDEPEGQRYVIEALSQFAVHAKEKFPGVMFVWYIYDEPPYTVMDILPKMLKTYVDALKDIKFLVVSTPHADRLERYGIRVAGFGPSAVNPRVRNFDATWYYQYPADITDEKYLRNRFFPWQVYRADGEGVLLWNVVFYGNPGAKASKSCNPWENPAAVYENAGTTVFYPPRPGVAEGVVPSIRAINIGDAIEDFDYLKLYESKVGREGVQKLLSAVLPEATATPSDPFAFLELRRKMADELERASVPQAVGESLQERIDRAAAAGGGVVDVPPGVHESPALLLRRGVTLRLAEGAVLKAKTSPAAYAPTEGHAFILAEHADNVSVEGPGVIDGAGDAFADGSLDVPQQPRLVWFRDCRNVRVENVTLRNGRRWTLYLDRCDGAVVRKVKIRSTLQKCCDGIDLECRNALVEDCDIDSQDDAICFKNRSSDYTVCNVEVRNCRLATNSNFIKVGTETLGTIRDVCVHHCTLHQASFSFLKKDQWPEAAEFGLPSGPNGMVGVSLQMNDGGILENVRVHDLEMVSGVGAPFCVRLTERGKRVLPGKSALRNVVIENVRGRTWLKVASSVIGTRNIRPQNILFRNIDLEVEGGGSLPVAVPEIEPGDAAKEMWLSIFDAYGFCLRHADGVRFENVILRPRRATDRPLFTATDCTDVESGGLVAESAK